MKSEEVVRFSFLLSGGEEMMRIMEIKGMNETNFLRIIRDEGNRRT